MRLSNDEIAALIDAAMEYADHHLPTLARAMPGILATGQVDELRGNMHLLLARLRQERTDHRTTQTLAEDVAARLGAEGAARDTMIATIVGVFDK